MPCVAVPTTTCSLLSYNSDAAAVRAGSDSLTDEFHLANRAQSNQSPDLIVDAQVNPELESSNVVDRHEIECQISGFDGRARGPWPGGGSASRTPGDRRGGSNRRSRCPGSSSSRRNKIGPIASSSPGCSRDSSSKRPLTRTPLRLPRSRIKTRSYAVAMQQWRREILGESMRTSQSGCRPIKRTGRYSAIDGAGSLYEWDDAE